MSVFPLKLESFFQRKCEVNHKIFPGVLFMLCAGKFCDSLRIFSGKKDSKISLNDIAMSKINQKKPMKLNLRGKSAF